MSLYNFIYNLQRKPDRAKKRVIVLLMTFCFIALAAFWVFTFRQQVSGMNIFSLRPVARNKAVETGSPELLSPVAALVEGFKGLKSDIAAKLKDAAGGLSNPSVAPSDGRVRKVYELPK